MSYKTKRKSGGGSSAGPPIRHGGFHVSKTSAHELCIQTLLGRSPGWGVTGTASEHNQSLENSANMKLRDIDKMESTTGILDRMGE